MSKTKYIFTNGELSRKDNSLMFRNEYGKINYFPIEGIREIYILSEVSINTKLLDYLSRYGIIIHFFNFYSNYSGSYYPRESYLSGRLLLKQLKNYDDTRLIVARAIVKGIGINCIEVLYHYYRHGKDIKSYIETIKELINKQLNNADNIKLILFVEGQIWQNFYDAIRKILPIEFEFKQRVKRLPDNPINAMISFGNTLLYTKTISSIYQTHLNPTISYLHEPSEQRFSLSLDISEVFKPIIVFRTILELVNNKKINAEKHFVKEINYALLNEEGKKIFIAAFEERLERTFKHNKLNRNVSYYSLIKFDCYKLIKFIMEGTDFVPYSDKDKQ